jgi:hypothetical protein
MLELTPLRLELKPLHKAAIPKALEKAEKYRLLNEPAQAESICHDILRVEPAQQQTLITLLLALTDQFDRGIPVNRPRELLSRLEGEYERAYYAGIICERKARERLNNGGPGGGFVAYELLCDALRWYEQAEALRPPDNDDAALRWNACVRLIRDQHLKPRQEERLVLTSE